MPATEHFVDGNVFLRFLTNDVPAQAEAIERLFRSRGRACLTVCKDRRPIPFGNQTLQ